MYKTGSPDDKFVDSHPHRLQGQKVKSHGAGAYCGGHLAAQLVLDTRAVEDYKTWKMLNEAKKMTDLIKGGLYDHNK